MAPITTAYAALLGLVFVALSVRVIRHRRQTRTPLGPGHGPMLQRAIRAHGNFAEYVPLTLLLILLAELGGAPAWGLHATGLLLLSGRLVHAFGVSREPETYRFRVSGMALTFTAIIVAVLLCLFSLILAPG